MQKLFHAIVLILCWGGIAAASDYQAMAPAWRPLPATASESARRDYFDLAKVFKIRHGWAEVSGEFYGPEAVGQYYKQAGCGEAWQLQDQAQHASLNSWRVPGGCILGGVVLGGLLGRIQDDRFPDSYTKNGGANFMAYGVVFGAIGGVVVGMLPHFFYRAQARHLRSSAAQRFNQYLLQSLHLELLPGPGGAKAGISGNF